MSPNVYDEYGNQAVANAGRFQYTGQMWLPEFGLYYYKARIYNPIIGRLMQTDPIGMKDQVNLYEYGGDDPLNSTDPTGQAVCAADTPASACAQLMADQAAAIKDNAKAQKALDKLQSERKEIADGSRKKLTGDAQRTEKVLKKFLGSATDADVQGVKDGLAAEQGFLTDMSGESTFRIADAHDYEVLANRPDIKNPAMWSLLNTRPHSVAVFPAYTATKDADLRRYYMLHDAGHQGGLNGQPEVYGVANIQAVHQSNPELAYTFADTPALFVFGYPWIRP